MVSRRRLRGNDDRGVVAVEMAIVLPLLMMILLGMTNAGFSWLNANDVSGSIRSASRVLAAGGDQPLADWAALEALEASLGDRITVDKLIIFKSTTTNGDIPAACLTAGAELNGGVADQCNIYLEADIDNHPVANYGTAGCLGPDGQYCPQDRWVASTSGGPEYAGVAIWVTHDLPFNMSIFGTEFSDKVIVRLAPDVAGP